MVIEYPISYQIHFSQRETHKLKLQKIIHELRKNNNIKGVKIKTGKYTIFKVKLRGGAKMRPYLRRKIT